MSLSSLLINLKHPCWKKSINFYNFSPPTKKKRKKIILTPSELLQKTKKIEQQEEHVAGDGLIIENAIWCSASRRRCESGRTSGFPSNGCNLSSSAHKRYLSNKMKMPSKLFWRTVGSLQKYTHKSSASRFDFETCSAHVYSTKSNNTNK